MPSDASMSQLVTWALVVLGWLIVARQNDEREFRKEVRARIDALSGLLADTVALAIDFYTRPGGGADQDERRHRILASLSEIGRKATALMDKPDSAAQRIAEFRRSITLNSFDDRRRPASTIADPRLAEIHNAAAAVESDIETRFGTRFKKFRRL